jgi:hypothetical protein
VTAIDWARDETFCFAVLPDTQIMTEFDPSAYLGETHWLAENADALDLRLVLHVGDVVNKGRRDPAQYLLAAQAHRSLLDAGIPLLVVPGNHDYDNELDESRELSLFNAHVGFAALAGQPSIAGTFAPGAVENSYALLDAPSGGVIVVALEFGPRPAVIAWAEKLLVRHAGRSAFVLTHSYLDPDSRRTHMQSSYHPRAYPGSADALDGEQLWAQTLRRIPNLVGVFCGHQVAAPVSWRVDAGDTGNGVLQSFQNWQMAPPETMPRIRLVWWRPSTRQLRMRVVDTRTGEYVDEPGSDVELVLDGSTDGTSFAPGKSPE